MRGDEFFKRVAIEPPFSKLHPKMAGFFKGYMAKEKVIPFNDQYVLNTHFPPYPSAAFDNLAEQFNRIGDIEERRLFSVTFAVTNRCNYNCWHCYNAGRCQEDVPLVVMKKTARALQRLGAVKVTLTGGEPLLRENLEEIAECFDERTCLALNTTGDGLTPERGVKLRDSGIFAVGVSLDSMEPEEHDRLRGRQGAFRTALKALGNVADAGMYPYVITVASHDLLQADQFWAFMKFASEMGAREVHLLEPCATGKLAGNTEALLSSDDRRLILARQEETAQREDLPILSTFTYLESSEGFGCGAGLTHLYIDGSGEVCPCNLVPLSFGNVSREPLEEILDRMSAHFKKPRTGCIGNILAKHIPDDGPVPTPAEESSALCEACLAKTHAVPRFFQAQTEAWGEVGAKELEIAYDQIHEYYDTFWVKEAGRPVEELIRKMNFQGAEKVFEAGCGTGFATVRIAENLKGNGALTAVDLSEGMLNEARDRARKREVGCVQFVVGDALEVLGGDGEQTFDIVFSSWVLGYIKLAPFFTRAARALADNGRLAFIVHKENSPREPLEIFAQIVSRDPAVLLKRVAFDFPRDSDHVRRQIISAGLEVENLWEGKVEFSYKSPEAVLEHLLKSGAGTAYYDAVDPAKRESLEKEFCRILAGRQKSAIEFDVVHDYIACIARKLVV